MFVLLAFISFVAMYSDVRNRRISNMVCGIVFFLSMLYGFNTGDGSIPILRMVSVVLVGFILFSFSIIGAGDVKLLAAYSLGISDQYWLPTLYFTVIFGGGLALCYVTYGVVAGKMNEIKARGLPYGVPIALACMCGLWLSGL